MKKESVFLSLFLVGAALIAGCGGLPPSSGGSGPYFSPIGEGTTTTLTTQPAVKTQLLAMVLGLRSNLMGGQVPPGTITTTECDGKPVTLTLGYTTTDNPYPGRVSLDSAYRYTMVEAGLTTVLGFTNAFPEGGYEEEDLAFTLSRDSGGGPNNFCHFSRKIPPSAKDVP